MTEIGSGTLNPPTRRVAPFATVVDCDAEDPPSALALLAPRIPSFTLVAPVYVFVPDNVSVPVPVFVNEPEPEMMPLIDALLSPATTWMLESALSVTLPVTVAAALKYRAPSVEETPDPEIVRASPVPEFSLRVAPLDTVVPPVVAPKALELVMKSVPALMVVVPL